MNQSQIDAENDQLANEREAEECALVDLATKGRKDDAARLDVALAGADTAALIAEAVSRAKAAQTLAVLEYQRNLNDRMYCLGAGMK